MTSPIEPLRKKRQDGTIYRRPEEIEAAITSVSLLPVNEVIARARITNSDDDHFVPTECLLYWVRRSTFGDNDNASYDLFAILLDRVERMAVPELTRRDARSPTEPQNMVLLEIKETILEKFQDLLCNDQADYEERLDFYECKFNSALAKLRLTARRDVPKRHAHTQPLAIDEESNEPSGEVEEAFAKLKEPADAESTDFLYRLKLRAAINSLPEEERRVIELLEQGFPIESQDDQVLSIVKVVGCSEKTVRNRRDRALKRLQAALKEDDQ